MPFYHTPKQVYMNNQILENIPQTNGSTKIVKPVENTTFVSVKYVQMKYSR